MSVAYRLDLGAVSGGTRVAGEGLVVVNRHDDSVCRGVLVSVGEMVFFDPS